MELACVHHEKRSAQARCVECGNLLCADCRAKVEGRNYCRPCVPEPLRRKLKGTRSPTFAAALSVVPGLGQWYGGSFFRALVFGGSAIALAANQGQVPDPVPLFLWVYNLFDAFSMVKERNAKVTGLELSGTDQRQKRFWGWFAATLSAFTVARATVAPTLDPDLLWPAALSLYGAFLLTDRKGTDRAAAAGRVAPEARPA